MTLPGKKVSLKSKVGQTVGLGNAEFEVPKYTHRCPPRKLGM